jgi:hypothetical protein
VIEFGGAGIAAAAEAVTDFGDLQRLEDREAVIEFAQWLPPCRFVFEAIDAKSRRPRTVSARPSF